MEFSKYTLLGGKCGCRRCLVVGQYVEESRHYYYGNFRERSRFPPDARSQEYHLEQGLLVENAPNNAVRKTIQRETGASGVSFLYDLNRLYDFDPIKDMMVDRMHLSSNMVKREFIEKLWKDMGENADLPVNERNVQNGGLLVRDEFKEGLEAVNWNREQKDKGIPKIKKISDKLGGWKHNDYIQFSTVAREVLACKIPSAAYDVFLLVCHVANLLYNKSLQRNGWSDADIEDLKKALWTHAIKAEELYGLRICTENLEYSVHIPDDIRRHSSPDNYSCELFERAIRTHKQQSHNSKGIEASYALRENLRQFLYVYEFKNGPLSRYDIGIPKYRFNMALLQQVNANIFLHERSFEAAVALIQDLEQIVDHDGVKAALEVGVAVGKLREQQQPPQIVQDIRRHLQENEDQYVIIKTVPSLVKRNTFHDVIKFSKGDSCILAGGENLEEDWYVEITNIFKVELIGGNSHLLVNGTYYIPGFHNGQVASHNWTNTIKHVPHQYARWSVQPAKNIKRKVILYPDPMNINEPDFYLPVDFDCPHYIKELHVPVWPIAGDGLRIQGHGAEVWFCQVQEVNGPQQTIKVCWFQQGRRENIWTLSRREDVINFNSIISRFQIRRVVGGFQLDA